MSDKIWMELFSQNKCYATKPSKKNFAFVKCDCNPLSGDFKIPENSCDFTCIFYISLRNLRFGSNKTLKCTKNAHYLGC